MYYSVKRSKEESEQLKKYIENKRHERDDKLTKEKKSKVNQRSEQKAKLLQLKKSIKQVAQQPLPQGLIKTKQSPRVRY
jgi:hypothetical protein